LAGRGAGRSAVAYLNYLLLACVALLLAAAPAAAAGWSKPFQFQKPGTLDAIAPQLTFAPGGGSTAAFGTLQVDVPGTAQAQYVQRTGGGRVGAVRDVPGARRILAMSYDGPQLELLAGTSGRLQDCCSAVEAIRVSSGGRPQRPHRLVPNLAGFTQGALLTLAGGRMLAAVATERGVWVSQSVASNRFVGDQRISPNRQLPVSMDAASLGGSGSVVAWSAGSGNVAGATVPSRIWVADGTAKHAPAHAKVAVTVPSGHRIDQVALARAHSGATLAWIESWYDKRGAYHARVMTSDIGSHPSPRPLSPAGRIASGLSLAGDASGDQGTVWESCTAGGSCTVQGAGRPAGGRFSGLKTLGAIDPTQQPSLAIAPSGQLLAGWARGGHPVASVGFGRVTALSETTYAYAVTVAYGPKHVALASWDQGTLNPSVVASAYRAR
jgi:hypothetical protein